MTLLKRAIALLLGSALTCTYIGLCHAIRESSLRQLPAAPTAYDGEKEMNLELKALKHMWPNGSNSFAPRDGTTISGNSLPSSTGSFSSPVQSFIIFPSNDTDQSSQSRFEITLNQTASQSTVKISRNLQGTVYYWQAGLTLGQAERLNSSSFTVLSSKAIGAITPSTIPGQSSSPGRRGYSQHKIHRRMPQAINQDPAPLHLRKLSRNPQTPFDDPSRYYYHPSVGKGTTIYILDTGLNIDHNEYEKWIKSFPPSRQSEDSPDYPLRWNLDIADIKQRSDEDGHGTCEWSTAVSLTQGIARKASVVMVKTTDATDAAGNTVLTRQQLSNALSWIRDDVRQRGLQQKAIFLMPSIIGREEGWFHRSVFDDFKALKVLVVNIANNKLPLLSKEENVIDHYPALWKQAGRFALDNIIVVGSVKPNDEISDFVRNDPDGLIDVYAMAESIECPGKQGEDPDPVFETGTSFAAPQVAGLAAYLNALADPPLSRTPEALINAIKTLAWRRITVGGPKVIWNGVQQDCVIPGDFFKRGDNSTQNDTLVCTKLPTISGISLQPTQTSRAASQAGVATSTGALSALSTDSDSMHLKCAESLPDSLYPAIPGNSTGLVRSSFHDFCTSTNHTSCVQSGCAWNSTDSPPRWTLYSLGAEVTLNPTLCKTLFAVILDSCNPGNGPKRGGNLTYNNDRVEWYSLPA